MSIETAVEGDPAGCRLTGRALQGLARAVSSTSDFLADQSRLPVADFEGRTADAYRTTCAERSTEAAASARDTRELARALASFADGLDGVRRVMREAREVARSRLVLQGTTIVEPDAYATGEQRRVHRTVREQVGLARQEEARLQSEWALAVTDHALGTTPPRSSLGGRPGSEPRSEPRSEPGSEPRSGPRSEPGPHGPTGSGDTSAPDRLDPAVVPARSGSVTGATSGDRLVAADSTFTVPPTFSAQPAFTVEPEFTVEPVFVEEPVFTAEEVAGDGSR